MINKKIRKAFFGYKKKDVLSYLKEYSDNVSLSMDEKQGEINGLELALRENSVILSDFKNQVASITEELSIANHTINQLISEKSLLNTKIEALLAQKDIISTVMIAAQREADNVRRLAHEKIEQERSDFEVNMKYRRGELEKEVEEMRGKSKIISDEITTLRDGAASALGKYKSELEYMISEYSLK